METWIQTTTARQLLPRRWAIRTARHRAALPRVPCRARAGRDRVRVHAPSYAVRRRATPLLVACPLPTSCRGSTPAASCGPGAKQTIAWLGCEPVIHTDHGRGTPARRAAGKGVACRTRLATVRAPRGSRQAWVQGSMEFPNRWGLGDVILYLEMRVMNIFLFYIHSHHSIVCVAPCY